MSQIRYSSPFILFTIICDKCLILYDELISDGSCIIWDRGKAILPPSPLYKKEKEKNNIEDLHSSIK